MLGNPLERERELAALDALLGETAADQGRIALVTGEAGSSMRNMSTTSR